jgi:hypothetical protein
MKGILKTSLKVLLIVGSICFVPSCEKNLSSSNQSGFLLQSSNAYPVFLPVTSSEEIVIVTDCNLNGWQKQSQPGATGTITFFKGPSVTPSGKGSLQFYCPDKKYLRLNNNNFTGTRLASVSELSYSTYVEQSGSLSDNIFVVIQVDINDDGLVDFPLVFNPVFQTGNYIAGVGPDQGVTLMSTWQNWDLLKGGWWRGDGPDPWNGGILFTLASFTAQYPNATVTNNGGGPGAIRISGGAPYFSSSFTGYADNFKIGIDGITRAFDLEETTANAGPDQTVVYGYGSNCVTLTGRASGGVAPYNFSWSPGGSTPDQASTEVCPTTTATYLLTVTDANGCSRTDDVTVFVNDVRCGENSDKVTVCHNGHEICVAANAVKAHLAHGDILGRCSPK